MRVIISYPLPFDNWATYRPWVEKFTRTFQQFPPGCDYEVWAVCNWGEPTDEVREWFYGIKTRFIYYEGNGCDLGGHQKVANDIGVQTSAFGRPGDAFIVGMTSRCFFYRAGWLDRLMKVREEKGPGIFFTSASKQGGILHGCTRAFGMDACVWRAYPSTIDSRQRGPFFEVGTSNPIGNLLEWYTFHKGLGRKSAWLVHWDNMFELPGEWARYVECRNRFRDGNQEQMLVHDWHSDQFNEATEEVKKQLNDMLVSI